ncbi:hypothetical protein [Aromatoleum petrolei]|uniref:Transposase IS4-like domain-containing protein n=1 Tax=Aromatoleum petrolei TaxID=76116 RepID=A0ABX1MP61_9RHOO|nr:hypothetical protein [Aromatoleum petrolei]NMF88125.1 hypothetical protein [Aromatoleum petrolei]QTQ38915.1 Uncharacterized protein ToN1_48210 [Aromatoleum petrolei]
MLSGTHEAAHHPSHAHLTLFDPKRRVRYLKEAVPFGLFLPDRELVERFTLDGPVCDERQKLVEHLDAMASDDLVLLDRGYPSAWLVPMIIDRDILFCMRCDVEEASAATTRRPHLRAKPISSPASASSA